VSPHQLLVEPFEDGGRSLEPVDTVRGEKLARLRRRNTLAVASARDRTIAAAETRAETSRRREITARLARWRERSGMRKRLERRDSARPRCENPTPRGRGPRTSRTRGSILSTRSC
jgi:hypothetical protein